MSYHSEVCKHSNPRNLAHTYTEMVGQVYGFFPPKHDSNSLYGPDISFRSSCAYFQNTKLKKELSRVCLSKRNIFVTIFFFVCVLEIQSRMDRWGRQRQTNKQTDSMCCTYTEI